MFVNRSFYTLFVYSLCLLQFCIFVFALLIMCFMCTAFINKKKKNNNCRCSMISNGFRQTRNWIAARRHERPTDHQYCNSIAKKLHHINNHHPSLVSIEHFETTTSSDGSTIRAVLLPVTQSVSLAGTRQPDWVAGELKIGKTYIHVLLSEKFRHYHGTQNTMQSTKWMWQFI